MSAETLKPIAYRQRLVLAYADSAHAALSCRQLRRLGWEVHLTSRGTEARRLTRELAPQVVVLDTDLHDESGWLTCAKLTQEFPGQRVVLVTGERTAEGERFAEHVGAALLVCRSEGTPALIDQLHRCALSSAG